MILAGVYSLDEIEKLVPDKDNGDIGGEILMASGYIGKKCEI